MFFSKFTPLMEISPELLRPACQNKFLYVCMYVCTELELISVIDQTNASVNTTTPFSTLSSTQLRSEYSDLFDGLGKMKDFQVHLHIDPSVPP
jgi:hypothetical protein